MVTVNNTSELSSELASSAGGKDIVLAEGVDFGPLSIANTVYAAPNVIRSANPANRSTINRFTTQNNGNLQFEDVAFIITDTSKADNYKHNSFYNTDDLSFTRCLFQMTQSGGLLNKGTGLGIDKGSRIDVIQCEFKNLHGGVTFLDNDFITVRDCNFHIIRTDCVNINDSNDIVVEDNWFHDSSDRFASDHVDMIQIARGSIRTRSLRMIIRRNVIDQGPSANYGQTIHLGLDGKSAIASTLHDDILIEDNYVHMGHSNAISFDWVNNCIIRNNSFLSAPPADIYSEPALKVLSSGSQTITIERNIFCQNQTTFGGGWTHSDNFYLLESTYGTNFTELSRTTNASYNDHEIKAGTAHHTALAGSRMQPREGGWGGNGIVPKAATLWGYQGGFQGGAAPVPVLPAGSVQVSITVA